MKYKAVLALLILLYSCFIISCARNYNDITNTSVSKISIEKQLGEKGKTIANIFNKLDQGNLTYDDIFGYDYGEYNEKNNKTNAVLDKLVDEIRVHSANNKNNSTSYKVDFDKMFEKNLDKIVHSLLKKENFKYNIYGSNRERWFSMDKNLKAPLNYLQQQVVLNASWKTLEKISCEILKTVIEGEEDYMIDFGTLWCVYGNGNKLNKPFNMMHEYINACNKKVSVEKQKLSEKEVSVLNRIIEMKNFEKIIATGFVETMAKSKIVSICKNEVEFANKVLKANEMLDDFSVKSENKREPKNILNDSLNMERKKSFFGKKNKIK